MPDAEAMRALEVVSLFEAVRISGDEPTDLAVIASGLAEMSEMRLREHLQRFVDRGIVVEKGRYAQVLPIPLAANLGQRRLKALQAQGVMRFFATAPDHLRSRLLERLKWLDTSQEAQDFARELLATRNLGSVAALNADFGSRCLDQLVHVLPDVAMSTLDQTVGNLSVDDLKNFGPGRRHIVWALEKLVFRNPTFETAARLLLKLAIAETETRISNNASGVFKRLFGLQLSGTEAVPSLRLRVLDDALASNNASVRRLAVDAAGELLKTNHFMRIGGMEAIGSQEPLRDWEPASVHDVWDFHKAGLKRLEAVAMGNDSIAAAAQTIIAENLRGLLSVLPVDDVAGTAKRIAAHVGVWREGIESVNHWLFFDRRRGARDEAAGKVEALYGDMMPNDPVDRVLLFASGWMNTLYNPEHVYGTGAGIIDFEYTNRQISALAASIAADDEQLKRVLDGSVGETLHSGYVLGKVLAEHAARPYELFDEVLRRLEARSSAGDPRFVRGVISGIETRDPQAARRCVDKALRSSILQKRAVDIFQGLTLSADDLQRVVEQLRAGNIDPASCAHMSYGRGLAGVEANSLAMLPHGVNRSWCGRLLVRA